MLVNREIAPNESSHFCTVFRPVRPTVLPTSVSWWRRAIGYFSARVKWPRSKKPTRCSPRVRELYIPLTQKEYWKIFWEQPVIAAAIVTPSQRELIPFFKNMLSIPAKDREHSQWQFGHPVTFADKSKAPSP